MFISIVNNNQKFEITKHSTLESAKKHLILAKFKNYNTALCIFNPNDNILYLNPEYKGSAILIQIKTALNLDRFFKFKKIEYL